MCGATARTVLVPSSNVWPSGVALATSVPAMVVDAPGRFSTMKGCLKTSASFSPMRRLMMSVPPPAVEPLMMRTGLVG